MGIGYYESPFERIVGVGWAADVRGLWCRLFGSVVEFDPGVPNQSAAIAISPCNVFDAFVDGITVSFEGGTWELTTITSNHFFCDQMVINAADCGGGLLPAPGGYRFFGMGSGAGGYPYPGVPLSVDVKKGEDIVLHATLGAPCNVFDIPEEGWRQETFINFTAVVP